MAQTYAYGRLAKTYTNSIVAGNRIKTIDFSEMNSAINEEQAWTEITPTVFDTNSGIIRAKHINDLIDEDNNIRAKLNLAWASQGQTHANSPASPSGLSQIIGGTNIIRKVHLSDSSLGIRNKIDDTRTKTITYVLDDVRSVQNVQSYGLFAGNTGVWMSTLAGYVDFGTMTHPWLYGISTTQLDILNIRVNTNWREPSTGAVYITDTSPWVAYNNVVSGGLGSSGAPIDISFTRAGVTVHVQWYMTAFSLSKYQIAIQLDYRYSQDAAPAVNTFFAWSQFDIQWVRNYP